MSQFVFFFFFGLLQRILLLPPDEQQFIAKPPPLKCAGGGDESYGHYGRFASFTPPHLNHTAAPPSSPRQVRQCSAVQCPCTLTHAGRLQLFVFKRAAKPDAELMQGWGCCLASFGTWQAGGRTDGRTSERASEGHKGGRLSVCSFPPAVSTTVSHSVKGQM